MGLVSTYLVASVDALLAKLLMQSRVPEMYRLSRGLTISNNPGAQARPVTSMETVSGWSRPAWPVYQPYFVMQAYDDLAVYWNNAIQQDPRTGSGVYSPLWVLRFLTFLDRQISFTIQMQHAYLDATRTHQETFYNTHGHQEGYVATHNAVADVCDYLYSG